MRLLASLIMFDSRRIASAMTTSCLGVQPRSVGNLSFSVSRQLSPDPRITDWRGRTEEIHHQRLLDGARLEVPKRHDGRGHLAEGKVLRGRGEGIRGVEGLGLDLASDLAIGEHVDVQDGGGPEAPG